MTSYPIRLRQIEEQLRGGIETPAESVRDLLTWFGAQRRGSMVNREIRRTLKKLRLRTEPDFEYEFIDAPIRFQLIGDKVSLDNGAPTNESAPTNGIPNGSVMVTESSPALVAGAVTDPTYRIGRLESANRPPISVNPDDTIQRAVTLMLANDYSQLPVMTSERKVHGVIGWNSIGRYLALGRACPRVRDCMDQYHVISSDTSLFAAIETIVENEYVLIQDATGVISGIVTTADLSLQFRQLGEPFLLLGEIENYIRRLISNKFTVEELTAMRDPSDRSRLIEDVSDLTLGECVRLLEQPDKWSALHLNADRVEFVKCLHEVRMIRNDVVHFDPDGIAPLELQRLRDFVNFMRILADSGAI